MVVIFMSGCCSSLLESASSPTSSLQHDTTSHEVQQHQRTASKSQPVSACLLLLQKRLPGYWGLPLFKPIEPRSDQRIHHNLLSTAHFLPEAVGLAFGGFESDCSLFSLGIVAKRQREFIRSDRHSQR